MMGIDPKISITENKMRVTDKISLILNITAEKSGAKVAVLLRLKLLKVSFQKQAILNDLNPEKSRKIMQSSSLRFCLVMPKENELLGSTIHSISPQAFFARQTFHRAAWLPA